MKISVIIPVYNVEKYLHECVDSVLAQSYQNFEIILVDDGSSDCSPAICDAYAEKDHRILVIHKENGGQSDARNCGIGHASGDYLVFMDSDDFWDDQEALERLVQRAKKSGADVINYSYKKYYETSGQKVPQFDQVPPMDLKLTKKSEQKEFLCSNFLYIASPCNKMIRRNIFKKGMMFEKGKSSEDIEWCARLLCVADSMDFVCENFYCYRQREGSITHTIDEKACLDLTENVRKCISLAKRTKGSLRKCLYMYSAYQYGTFFVVQAFAETCPKSCMEEMKTYRWILKYHGKNKKITGLYYICKVVGFNVLCKAIRLTKKIRS